MELTPYTFSEAKFPNCLILKVTEFQYIPPLGHKKQYRVLALRVVGGHNGINESKGTNRNICRTRRPKMELFTPNGPQMEYWNSIEGPNRNQRGQNGIFDSRWVGQLNVTSVRNL
jgi:hypothetical protein|eukprot:COSAG01_NODE_207_length_22017_cov_118.361164_8_plen_115_part_00